MNDRRNAQARMLNQVFLDGVAERGALDRADVARAAHARDLAEAVRHQLAGFVRREVQPVEDFVNPAASQLGDLLVERHLRQQVIDAIFN